MGLLLVLTCNHITFLLVLTLYLEPITNAMQSGIGTVTYIKRKELKDISIIG